MVETFLVQIRMTTIYKYLYAASKPNTGVVSDNSITRVVLFALHRAEEMVRFYSTRFFILFYFDFRRKRAA